MISDLEPGTSYQFSVYSVQDDIESTPVMSVASTSIVIFISLLFAFNASM